MRVAQHADELGGQHRLQNLDGLLDIALIVPVTAPLQMLAGAVAQGLHVGKKRLVVSVLLIRAGLSMMRFLLRRVFEKESYTTA